MPKLPEFFDTPNGPTVAGASPALLAALLDELVNTLGSLGIHLDYSAQPGLPESEIRARLAQFGLTAPDELVVWFSWRNGYSRESEERRVRMRAHAPIPNLPLTDLASSLESYQGMLDFVAPPGPPEDPAMYYFGAGPGWIRLTSSAVGVAIECLGNPEETPRVRFTEYDFSYVDPPMYQAVSLCTPVAWTLYGIREGAYTWDPATRRWSTAGFRLHPSQRAAGFS